jgi:hypothetical protein
MNGVVRSVSSTSARTSSPNSAKTDRPVEDVSIVG